MENGVPPHEPRDSANFQQQPPMQPGAPLPPPGYGYAAPQYAEESQAVLSLVLSVIGLMACSGLLCPFGWYIGNKDLKGIAAGLRDPSKRDMAKAGQIIGIIGSVILGLAILAFGGFFLIALLSAGAAVDSSSTPALFAH